MGRFGYRGERKPLSPKHGGVFFPLGGTSGFLWGGGRLAVGVTVVCFVVVGWCGGVGLRRVVVRLWALWWTYDGRVVVSVGVALRRVTCRICVSDGAVSVRPSPTVVRA